MTLLWKVLFATKVSVYLGTVGQDRVQLVLIKELVEAACPRIVLLILLVHDADVLYELVQEGLHALGRGYKLHDLVQGSVALCAADGAVDLIVLLKSLQSRRWIEVLVTQPVQLLINVLLWEDKDLEFL